MPERERKYLWEEIKKIWESTYEAIAQPNTRTYSFTYGRVLVCSAIISFNNNNIYRFNFHGDCFSCNVIAYLWWKLNFSGRFSAYLTLLLPIHVYFNKYHNPNPLLNSNLDLISEVFSNFEYHFSSTFQKIEEKNLLIGLAIFSVFFTGIKLYLVSNDLYCDSLFIKEHGKIM